MAVDRIEGHLKWTHDLEPIIQEYAKEESESLESYCTRLLGNNIEAANADDPEEQLNQYQEEENMVRVQVNWTRKATVFARNLNKVALSILTGNIENAQLDLEKMDSIVEDLDDSTGSQCQVILYCMNALRWQIGGGVDDEVAERLDRQWEEIIGSNERMATVCFLKGMCGLNLTIEDKAVEEYYLKAILLDPNCLVWYHHAYRCLRRSRGRGGMQGGPSDQEVELARKAYQLCSGEDMVSVVNYGLTLKEFLWTQRCDEMFWRNEEERYLKCVQLFEKAMELATTMRATGNWFMKSKLFLAEFLWFGSAPKEAKMRGREMFFELERDYPNSLPVLHKLGNLYRNDGSVPQARNCYKRALEIHPTMVPCIMDYLQLLKENRRKNAYLRNNAKTEIARVLDQALSPEFVLSNRHAEKLRNERRKLESWY